MAPTTPLTAGYIYVCDWLDDDTNADEQDLDGKTAGINYFYFPIPTRMRDHEVSDIEYELYAENKGYFMRLLTIQGDFRIEGYLENRTQLGYLQTYLKKRSDADNIADPDYLFIKYGSNDWYPFSNESGSLKEYCRGTLIDKAVGWDELENQVYIASIIFKEVWS